MADYRKRLQYQAQAIPVAPSAVVPLDFVVQHPGPIFLPPWRDRTHEARPVVFAFLAIPTDWNQFHPEPVRSPPSLEHVTVTPIVLSGAPADIYADQPVPLVFPEEVHDVPREQYAYPSFFFQIDTSITNPPDPFVSIVVPVSYPSEVNDVARLQYTFQSFALELFGVGNLRIFYPSDYDPVLEVPLFDIPRRQYSYPFFERAPATEEITPVTDIFANEPVPVVYPDQVFDRERLQHSYPTHFMQLANWPTVIGPDTKVTYHLNVFFPVTHKRRVYL